MLFIPSTSPMRCVVSILLALLPFISAERVIESSSLTPCQGNSSKPISDQGFSASLFNVAFTPSNHSLGFNFIGVSTINAHVNIEIDVTAYGYPALSQSLNPCTSQLQGLCPMQAGEITIDSNIDIDPDTVAKVPGIAYTIPDLDGQVQIRFIDSTTFQQLACVQAQLSNGKTVYQKGVGWSTAVIAGLALVTAAIVSGLGHSNTAAHVAANTMSLFGYFQTQAMFGMTAVDLPPIVASWTQNFQWSMGIIHIDFIQTIASWYQRATGGTASQILSRLGTTSVNVSKRSLGSATSIGATAAQYASRSAMYFPELMKRAKDVNAQIPQTIEIHGIKRVGFVADIEPTNIFMTGYIFFIIFVMFVILGVVIFKYILEALAKSGKIKGDQFQDFRNGWTTVLKGILFRIVLIGFPQMVVLCFWEFTVRDSAGCIALAVVTILSMLVMLGWACFKVVRLAQRSISMHKNPAYILYSDPVSLHKWGFLYVQFKATAYWFVIPILGFILVVGMFVGLGQGSDIAQAIGLLILFAALLVGMSIMRPYMDKKTNAFNIGIAAVNFASAVFLLFFTDIFGLPGLVVGIMGIIFFVLNAVMSLVLLIMVLVATGFAIFSKNPDVRYQPMRDDRGSFIKSQSNLNTELDALGATARGEGKGPFGGRDIDGESFDSRSQDDRINRSGYNSMSHYDSKGAYESTAYDSSPYASQNYDRSQSMRSTASPNRTASPWQRGAGYER